LPERPYPGPARPRRPAGQPGQVGARTAAGLDADAVRVGPDSADANVQLTGDLRIGVAMGHQRHQFPFLAPSAGIRGRAIEFGGKPRIFHGSIQRHPHRARLPRGPYLAQVPAGPGAACPASGPPKGRSARRNSRHCAAVFNVRPACRCSVDSSDTQSDPEWRGGAFPGKRSPACRLRTAGCCVVSIRPLPGYLRGLPGTAGCTAHDDLVLEQART
jgi:hypothetical protein